MSVQRKKDIIENIEDSFLAGVLGFIGTVAIGLIVFWDLFF